MIQLKVLSGKQAGFTSVARRFPFIVGRLAGGADLSLDEPGVWDRHFQIDFRPGEGFVALPQGEALMTVNGHSTQGLRLANGDSIEIGGVRLQFWLGETRQHGFRLREWLVWSGIVLVTLSQIGLIYWLIQ